MIARKKERERQKIYDIEKGKKEGKKRRIKVVLRDDC